MVLRIDLQEFPLTLIFNTRPGRFPEGYGAILRRLRKD